MCKWRGACCCPAKLVLQEHLPCASETLISCTSHTRPSFSKQFLRSKVCLKLFFWARSVMKTTAYHTLPLKCTNISTISTTVYTEINIVFFMFRSVLFLAAGKSRHGLQSLITQIPSKRYYAKIQFCSPYIQLPYSSLDCPNVLKYCFMQCNQHLSHVSFLIFFPRRICASEIFLYLLF